MRRSLSSKNTCPEVGLSNPPTRFSSVVLPDPDLPRSRKQLAARHLESYLIDRPDHRTANLVIPAGANGPNKRLLDFGLRCSHFLVGQSHC